MMGRTIHLFAGTLAALLLIGCETAPEPKPEPEVKRPPTVIEVPERKPAKVGDYIYYPLKWRNAGEAAAELQAALYPKYGPYLRVVPDFSTNALLIYLPPPSLRWMNGIDPGVGI